jgi:transposase
MQETLERQSSGKIRPERYSVLMYLLPDIWHRVSSGKSNLLICWAAYRTRHPDGYGYSQFTAYFHSWHQAQGLPAIRPQKWCVADISSKDKLELDKWRHSNNRLRWAKAVTILELKKGAQLTTLSEKLEKSPRLIKRWRQAYLDNGLDGLRSPEHRHQSKETLIEIKRRGEQLIQLMHESPGLHGINRTSWSLKALAEAYVRKYGESVCQSTISEHIRSQGYSFKKARKVLTSPDPEYLPKLKEITRILSGLQEDEAFFSIDEFGPFSVKRQGGRAFSPSGVTRVIPQWQKSKGRLILTAALELSTNQLTHFYSEKKNTIEMIKLMDTLLAQYSSKRCLYLSWDAASWHMSEKLYDRVLEINADAAEVLPRSPIITLAPLPSSAQFLNVIESVFSGMARAVIHNSDYESFEECKNAIDRYIAERNRYYMQNPKRAGDKIWGKEIVLPTFSPSNNCKDPNWR